MTFPARIFGFRWLLISWAIITFFWLSREDNDVRGVVLLGLWLAVLVCGRWITTKLGGKFVSQVTAVVSITLTGAIIGISTSLITAGLMVFKNVRHVHIFPDYPFELVGAIVQRAPIWALVGGLLGMAIALLWIAFHRPNPLQSDNLNPSE